MKLCCIIQARMGSSRLPGKVLMQLSDKSVLGHIIDRIKRCKNIDDIIVATSIEATDNPIENECVSYGVKCFRGSEEDVLERLYLAAKEHSADAIVRITADCPLIDPLLVAEVAEIYNQNISRFDYGSNIDNVGARRTFPRGFDVEVFSFNALENAHKNTIEHREHVTAYIYTHMAEFRIFRLEDGRGDNSDIRLVLDTPDDFKLVNEVYNELHGGNPNFGYPEILELFRNKPQLKQINKHIEQKHSHFELKSTGNEAVVFKLL